MFNFEGGVGGVRYPILGKSPILATSVFLYYPPGLPEIKGISLALILVDRQKFGQTAAKCKEYLLFLFSKIFIFKIIVRVQYQQSGSVSINPRSSV